MRPLKATAPAASRGLQPACLVACSQVRPSRRRPDLVAGAVAREPAVVPAAHEPHPVVEDERHRQVAVLPGGLAASRASRLRRRASSRRRAAGRRRSRTSRRGARAGPCRPPRRWSRAAASPPCRSPSPSRGSGPRPGRRKGKSRRLASTITCLLMTQVSTHEVIRTVRIDCRRLSGTLACAARDPRPASA